MPNGNGTWRAIRNAGAAISLITVLATGVTLAVSRSGAVTVWPADRLTALARQDSAASIERSTLRASLDSIADTVSAVSTRLRRLQITVDSGITERGELRELLTGLARMECLNRTREQLALAGIPCTRLIRRD